MRKYEYTGKTFEDAKEQALKELNVAEENLIINITEEKNSLLKKSTTIEVINYVDIINYAKEVINEITKMMGLTVNLEVRKKEDTIKIVIEDRGKGIEDISMAMQPLYTSKPELERSVMGFTVMESFMDGVEVSSIKNDGTKIVMTKKINLPE